MTGLYENASLGAVIQSDGRVRFRVWAPHVREIAVRLVDSPVAPITMQPAESGYYEVTVSDVAPGALYYYHLNGAIVRPDPASRCQPQGIHEASQVTSTQFAWTDAAWRGRPWQEYVIYEAHVGTFTSQGTFDAIIQHLDELARLGVTALQLMPVAQFPGERNWGYDGVHPFAPQNNYGGPQGLKRLVDACHERGLAVVLDVVYNHLGPEGNYLQAFGPYFTDRYTTPWGRAINFDGAGSDAVRGFFIANALYWLGEFHVDALRLDATHAMFDRRPNHFLRELAETVRVRNAQSGRPALLIAENSIDDPKIVSRTAEGGYGLDAQYLDDFQRSLHAALTGERFGYYADFGDASHFARTYSAGFGLTGQYSQYRQCRWGADASHISADRFVVYSQNHDTVGNRPGGERLGRLVDFESLKLAAAATILSPCIPMLFMGEEYDEPAPFHFFTSYLDPRLAATVRVGRLRELAALGRHGPKSDLDPQSPDTFAASTLKRSLASSGYHDQLWKLYQELLRLRRDLPAVRQADRKLQQTIVLEGQNVVVAQRSRGDHAICVCFNFGQDPQALPADVLARGNWTVLLDTSESRWGGPRGNSTACAPASPLVVERRSCMLLESSSRA